MESNKSSNTSTSTNTKTNTKSNNTTNTKSNNTSSNNSKNETKKKLAGFGNFLPSLLHTFIKLLPVGLYVSALLESVLFNDIRGFFIFIGLVINDLINIGYSYTMDQKKNERCAIVRNMYTDDSFILSTPHTQYMSFVIAFLLSSMYFKKIFSYSVFSLLMIILGLTIWSRISVGCKDILDAGYNIIFGAFRGIIYYLIIKDYYEPEDVEPEDHWINKYIKKYFPSSDADDVIG